MKQITFLLIDNANFGSIIMEYIRNIYPEIHSNLNNKDINFNIYDHPYIIEKYIDTYLYIIYYFNEIQGIPLSNIIFFRDCNHSSNWRKKYILTYKDGKSRFADNNTFIYFEKKEQLIKESNEDSIPFEKKWELEDQLDILKIQTKRNEKFIHELASIERFIHFYLNDYLCSLSDRTCTEADEQIYVFSQYLLQEYPNCNIKILSNDTDMIQCFTNGNFIDECFTSALKTTFDTNYQSATSIYPIKTQLNDQIQVIKCFRHSIECLQFKNIKDMYKSSIFENFIIHKVFCGKKNDNLPDPSSNYQKQEWFNSINPDVYKYFTVNKEKCIQSILHNPILASSIKNNIICSSFTHLPKDIFNKIIQNCISIENKIKERDGGFKPLFHDKLSSLFLKKLPILKRTVTNWIDENIIRNSLELLLNELTKKIGRDIFLDYHTRPNYNDYIIELANKIWLQFQYELKRCKKKWLKKYINLWFTINTYTDFSDEEFNSKDSEKSLQSFIKPSYQCYTDKIQIYIYIIGNHYLNNV